jgi:hypothetical protein
MPYYIAQNNNPKSLRTFDERLDAKKALVAIGVLEDDNDFIANPDYAEYKGWDLYDDGSINNWLNKNFLGGPKFFSVGDYGGCGSVGEANIRWVEQNLPEDAYFVWEGGYSSKTIWLVPSDEAEDICDRLEQYPLICEDLHQEVLQEWECADWDNWIKDSLFRKYEGEFPKIYPPNNSETLDQCAWEAYHEAKEAANVEWVSEYNGGYVNCDAIFPEFNRILVEKLAERLKEGESRTN